MSRDSYTLLKRHLQTKKNNFLLNLIQEHLYIDVFDGIPRNKKQISAVSGALGGEARREANKVSLIEFFCCLCNRVPTESWNPSGVKLWTFYRFDRIHGKVMKDGFHWCFILVSLYFGKTIFFKGV